MQVLTILGATGSIGESTLDVIARHPERFRIHALTAHTQVEKLAAQCARFHPEIAVVGTPSAASELEQRLRALQLKTVVAWGEQALAEVASADCVTTVMAAIVGAAGLPPTLAAARSSKRVLLANKEALVVAGQLFMDAVHDNGATLLPIDSEHNAIFQCLPAGAQRLQAGVEKIILTASGGPFRDRAVETLAAVTPQEACAHPNWVMGRKISVDSATMMNKGLEVIEAHWLFAAPAERIEVVIHPQSIIHSMVSYADGSVLAQLGNPDMRTPIAYGLGWPERFDAGVAPLDLTALSGLNFEKPDLQRFPCLGLAYEALKTGGTAAVVLNAANEIAVAAFLEGRLRFTGIADLVDAVLQQMPVRGASSLDELLDEDRRVREIALEHVHNGLLN